MPVQHYISNCMNKSKESDVTAVVTGKSGK